MKLEVKDNCPLNGFEPCKQFDCAWFMKIQGNNPNTGEPTEEWGCADGVDASATHRKRTAVTVDRSGGREFQERDGVGQSGEPAPTKTSQNRGPPT